MTCYLKNLAFDCLSFTEGLITSLFTTAGEAPDFNRSSTTSVLPSHTSCFNRVIELNQLMLIVSRFVTENDFLCNHDN
jgi:hypothetical protein